MNKFCSNHICKDILSSKKKTKKKTGNIYVDSEVSDVYVKQLVCNGEWKGHVCFVTVAQLFCFEN